MNKFTLIMLVFFTSFTVDAKPLSCSANGTDIYYINGVLTNDAKNKIDTKAIGTLFNSRPEQLDLGKNIKFTGIFNPSFGLINDAAELFAQAYYAKTGKDDGKVIFNLVRNMPDKLEGMATGLDPNRLGETVGMFGIKMPLNISTLVLNANENILVALERGLASTESLLTEKDLVINSIANGVIRSKKDSRKSLFVAHSQGNAALVNSFVMSPSSASQPRLSFDHILAYAPHDRSLFLEADTFEKNWGSPCFTRAAGIKIYYRKS